MSRESIIERIRINKTMRPVTPPKMITVDRAMLLQPDRLEQVLADTIENTAKYQLETIPRKTVLTLVSTPIGEKFTFRVNKNEAENYIGAMRQVLSRTRKKAQKRKIRLDEFKMLLVEIKQLDDYDEITLVRSKTLSREEESVYDELLGVLKKD